MLLDGNRLVTNIVGLGEMVAAKGEPLTDQQRRVFRYVKEYIEEHGYAPLYREIQDGAELSNVGLVYKNLEALQKKGYIHKEKNKKRGIELTEIGKEVDFGDIPGQLNLFDSAE